MKTLNTIALALLLSSAAVNATSSQATAQVSPALTDNAFISYSCLPKCKEHY